MKTIAQFLTIYVLVTSGANQYVATYEGQDASTVQTLLAGEGKTGQFLTLKEYQDFIVSHPPAPIVRDPAKEQAKIDLNNAAKTDAERINAIIKYLDLDK